MKILVEFESLEEFYRYMKEEVPAAEEAPVAMEEAEPAITVVVPEPVDTGTGTIVGATPEEQKQIEAEEKQAPSYTLSDAQKAVREVVKLKGKDAAKKVLSGFKHKDNDKEPATGASALKPEDYAEAIRQLGEVLNA